MASAYETGHMRRVAVAEAALNREAVLRSAARSPSENIRNERYQALNTE